MNNKDVEYICNQMLKISWSPNFEPDVLDVLEKCDSKLEQMFILGACYFLKEHCENEHWITTSVVQHGSRLYTGIWYIEPWFGWHLEELPQKIQIGPSALLFVPQLKSSEKELTHDIGLFYGDDNGSPKWRLAHAVEIDGYAVHQDRREKDQLRDEGLTYSLMRFYEESDDPLEWFRKVVYRDVGWNLS